MSASPQRFVQRLRQFVWIALFVIGGLDGAHAAAGPGPYLHRDLSFNGQQLLWRETLWDAASGKELRRLPLGPGQIVRATRFSPDGTRAVTVTSRDLGIMLTSGPTILWDPATGKESMRFQPEDGMVDDAQFSPDGKRLLLSVSGTQRNANKAQIWDAVSGKLLLVFQDYNPTQSGPPTARTMSFSPGGRRVLLLTGKNVNLFDSETAELIRTMGDDENRNKPIFFSSTQFSPDGKLILTQQTNFVTRVWNAETGQQIQVFAGEAPKHQFYPGYALFTPDGQSVISGSAAGTAILWDIASGKEIRRFQNPGLDPWVVDEMVVSRDGKRLMAVCEDTDDIKNRASVRNGVLWNVETGEQLLQIRISLQSAEKIVGFAPLDETLLTVQKGQLNLWDGATGKALRQDGK